MDEYKLNIDMPAIVHKADGAALAIEAHDLMKTVKEWDIDPPPTGYTIIEMSPYRAEELFKIAFWEVCNAK